MMNSLSKFLIPLCVIVLGVLVYVLATILLKNSSEAVEEVLTSREPTISNTWVKRVSVVIAEEIDKTDKHRKERGHQLLTAMEQSPALQRALAEGNLSELEEELLSEALKQITNWFLNTDPPSPEQRRQIKAQIDEIVSMGIAIALEEFPELRMRIEEYARLLKERLLDAHNDAFNPTLKQPLSWEEIEQVRGRLMDEQRRIMEGFDHAIFENDAFAEQKRRFLTRSAIPRLFSAIGSSTNQLYRLPPTERLLQLGEAVHEEFVQQALVEDKRLDSMVSREADRALEEAKKEMELRDGFGRYDADREDWLESINADGLNELGDSYESLTDNYDLPSDPLFPWDDGEQNINQLETHANNSAANRSDAEMQQLIKELIDFGFREEDIEALIEMDLQPLDDTNLDDIDRARTSQFPENLPDGSPIGNIPTRRGQETKKPSFTDFQGREEGVR